MCYMIDFVVLDLVVLKDIVGEFIKSWSQQRVNYEYYQLQI